MVKDNIMATTITLLTEDATDPITAEGDEVAEISINITTMEIAFPLSLNLGIQIIMDAQDVSLAIGQIIKLRLVFNNTIML